MEENNTLELIVGVNSRDTSTSSTQNKNSLHLLIAFQDQYRITLKWYNYLPN
jgi:hypothetical protein